MIMLHYCVVKAVKRHLRFPSLDFVVYSELLPVRQKYPEAIKNDIGRN
jgi:hypothetical protein